MIKIEFEANKPIYTQMVEQICAAIKSGALKPGDKLPTERELAESLKVARGTVKSAYKELSDNNIIEVIQGSGSYVYSDRDVYTVEERRLALQMMDQLWEKLEGWNLERGEIEALFRLTAAKRAPSVMSVSIAIIDCNPESLYIFKRQLQYIPGIAISAFLLDGILMEDDILRLLGGFDLVLTTLVHHEKLSGLLSPHNIPLVAVAVSPSRQTIIDLSTLPPNSSIGILCKSNKFSNLIIEQLEQFADAQKNYPVCFTDDRKRMSRFLHEHDAIITPPELPVFDQAFSEGFAEKYLKNGKRIIPFDYRIDKGSLLHVESLVDNILKQRAERGK